MRTVKIKGLKVKVFEGRELKEKLNFTDDEAKLIMKYQKQFPELLQEENEVEGFVIEGRFLWEQLDKPYVYYADWMKKKVLKQKWTEKRDYITSSKKFEVANKGYKTLDAHYFTIEMAKHVAMMENTEKGRLVRIYFILMEKALRKMDEYILVREPEKLGYKELCKQLNNNYRSTHEGKEPNKFIYSNEADMINVILLGKKAKKIRGILGYKDNVTREHLNIEVNKALYELQMLDSSLIIANIDYQQRKAIVESTCKVKFNNLELEIDKELGLSNIA